MPPDLVVAGNLIVDDLVFPNGRTRFGEAGGAILYAALGATLWGASVGLASVAGNDYPAATLAALEARGIDLAGIRRIDRPGLRTWLLYEKEGRRVVHHLGSPAHAEVSPSPEALVTDYPEARAFHLAPMPFDHQRSLVAALVSERPRRDAVNAVGDRDGTESAGASPATCPFVSLDPHEPIREDNLGRWCEILEDVDMLFAGEDELRLEGAEAEPRASVERIGSDRLRFSAFKRGPRGGVLLDRREKRFHEWPGARPPIVDATGAGDAFAGGLIAGWIMSGNLERALEQGAVSASFAIENWGARGLLGATLEQAERRREAWFGARAGS